MAVLPSISPYGRNNLVNYQDKNNLAKYPGNRTKNAHHVRKQTISKNGKRKNNGENELNEIPENKRTNPKK